MYPGDRTVGETVGTGRPGFTITYKYSDMGKETERIMRISVFYDHITQAAQQTGKDLPELLQACRGWGIEGLEINYTQLRKGGAALRRELRRAGMGVSCIYEFYDFTHGGDLEQAKRHVDLAAKVGAERILIVPGFLEEQEARELGMCCDGQGSGGSRQELNSSGQESGGSRQDPDCNGQEPVAGNPTAEPENMQGAGFSAVARYMESHASTCQVREALRKLVDYGQKKGVKITLEDFDGYTSPCARMLPLQWLMEQVPGLGFTLDMGNFAYSGEDVTAAYELLKDYIVHVHCKDRGTAERGLACVPTGGGYLPIRELVMRLKAQGYDGYLAIEHFDAPDQLIYIRHSAEFLRGVAMGDACAENTGRHSQGDACAGNTESFEQRG